MDAPNDPNPREDDDLDWEFYETDKEGSVYLPPG
jgi:hypothetical protein